MFALAPLSVWRRAHRDGGGADPGCRGRLAAVLLASAVTAPARLAERVLYGRRVRKTSFEPPLIILGYGRSGTTHLHNLLTRDPRHGSVTTLQCVAPTFFLLARALPQGLLGRMMPARRPMDNMRVALDLPQEEEVAIANTTHMSYLHHLSFPRNAPGLYRRYVLMEGLGDDETRRWERIYRDVVRKAAIHAPGRRIVLKNTLNIARIPHLLRVFPNAAFVNIVRHPFVVHASQMNMFRKLFPMNQLQRIDREEAESNALDAYVLGMQRYLRDRSRIPDGRLVEVRFEDLEADPAAVLRTIYDRLGLGGWEAFEKPLREYLGTLKGYRKNCFEFDAATRDRLAAELGFALDEWNYDPAGPAEARS